MKAGRTLVRGATLVPSSGARVPVPGRRGVGMVWHVAFATGRLRMIVSRTA